MKNNNEIRFKISTEFKQEIILKINKYAPDLKLTSSLKKIFLIGWFHLLDNLQKNKNLLDIPLKCNTTDNKSNKKR